MPEIPEKVGGRKPTKKKSFSMDDFKKKIGTQDVPDKDLSWYKCSPALQAATGLPGFPKGYVSLSRGFTNTGKSTSVCEAAVAAQKEGDVVIFIDTENNIGKKRLELMGFDWDNNVMLLDNEYLLEKFGKVQDPKRREASIEDMAECIHYFLDLQESGELASDVLCIIDSLGTLDCIKSVNAQEKGSSDNNMWNANAFERAFKSILNFRVPNTRKVNKEFTFTLIAVQKIWLDSMGGGQPSVKHKGGEAFAYGARLIYHHGGVLTHGTKKITATSKKREVSFGIETKLNVVKNQVDGPLGGIALEGKIISTPHGFIGSESTDVAEYKKQHIQYFRDILGGDVDVDDINTEYKDADNDASFDVDDFNAKFGG